MSRIVIHYYSITKRTVFATIKSQIAAIFIKFLIGTQNFNPIKDFRRLKSLILGAADCIIVVSKITFYGVKDA